MGEGLRRVAKACGGLIAKDGDLSIRYDADGKPVRTVDLRVGQSVSLGPGITVTLVRSGIGAEYGGCRVMLGVDAPKDISVDREEVRRVKEYGYKGRAGHGD